MATKIVISTENTKAIEVIEKLKARKQEIKAALSKNVVLAKKNQK